MLQKYNELLFFPRFIKLTRWNEKKLEQLLVKNFYNYKRVTIMKMVDSIILKGNNIKNRSKKKIKQQQSNEGK